MRVGKLGLSRLLSAKPGPSTIAIMACRKASPRVSWGSSPDAGTDRSPAPRRLRMHRPVGDEQRARAGIEECAAETRHSFRAGTGTGGGIAGRQDHPIGVEFEREYPLPSSAARPLHARHLGAVSASAGWVRPLRSPGTSPWVANATIRKPDKSIRLTLCSLASLPRWSTLAGSA